ncbi:hypothetical protein [Paenibacillus daejeonensis]|uniref:hypothetical protein n=1 Tax=Paenibacillus daejeonensis TaxID=135193 RepID=UPI000367A556|nr:hypothetical protein [Paenibacillus daejeonensis]
MGFKEQVALDNLAVFVNPEEFGELHDLDGIMVLCVLDEDAFIDRANDYEEGVFRNRMVLYVNLSELGYVPEYDQMIVVNGSPYMVRLVKNEMGMLTVTLEGNQT